MCSSQRPARIIASSSSARRASSETKRVLPMPGSPDTRTTPGVPAAACFQASTSEASSSRSSGEVEAALGGQEAGQLRCTGRDLRGEPADLEGSNRPVDPLEVEVADGHEHVAAAATRHELHHLGAEDLPGSRGGLQPLGLDHREPEAVVVLEGDVTDRQSDAHLEPLLAARRLCRSMACWMATAPASPSAAPVKVAITPSPSCFTTVPRWARMAVATSRSWTWRSSSAASSPRRVRSSVEPTRSVNSTVAVSARAPPPSVHAGRLPKSIETHRRDAGGRWDLEMCDRRAPGYRRGLAAHRPPSSSGLGHHPLKVAARVRIPLGVLYEVPAQRLGPTG